MKNLILNEFSKKGKTENQRQRGKLDLKKTDINQNGKFMDSPPPPRSYFFKIKSTMYTWRNSVTP